MSMMLLSANRFALCFLFCQAFWAVTGTNQTALLRHLFREYNTSVRPICGADQPIDVKVGLAVRQIIELDEPKQILYLNAWMRLVWTDCHLQWTPGNFANISNLNLPYENVWAPDITLYDNAVGTTPGLTDYRVSVYSDGTVYYNFPTVISVMCQMDVTYFPFDMQTCPLIFGSWSYHGLQLNLTNRSAAGDISSFVPNSEFDITSLPLERHVVVYGCCPEPYPDVTFYVHMKRKPMFYVTNLLFPSIVITSVALLGFLLPADSGEKVSLEITVLLSMAVFLLVVSETLPPTSETFPYIGVYFACCIVLVTLSTVLTVINLNVHHTQYLPLPNWMKVVFLRYMAKMVFFSDHSAKRARRIKVRQTENPMEKDGLVSTTANANLLSGHSSSSSEYQVNTGFEGTDIDECKTDFIKLNGINRMASSLGAEASLPPTDCKEKLASMEQILKEQVRLMKYAETRKDTEDRDDVQCTDWKNVAIILDRFFLLLFLLVSVITSLVVLIPLSTQ